MSEDKISVTKEFQEEYENINELVKILANTILGKVAYNDVDVLKNISAKIEECINQISNITVGNK